MDLHNPSATVESQRCLHWSLWSAGATGQGHHQVPMERWSGRQLPLVKSPGSKMTCLKNEVFGKGRVDGREECEWGNCSQVLWQERLGTGHLNVLTNWSYQRIHRLWSISGSVCILCRVSPLTCTQFFFWIWLEYFWSSLCWHAFFTFCQNASPLVIFYH